MAVRSTALMVLAASLMVASGCRIDENASAPGESMTDGSVLKQGLEQDVLDWRERRVARLTEPYGYLSLVELAMLEPGEHLVGASEEADITLPRGPAIWGRLFVEDGSARFELDPSAEGVVTVDGEAIESARLVAGDDPSLIEAEGVQAHLVDPGGRLALRVRDPQSVTRTGFAGLDYFPIDPDARVIGRWVPHEEGRTITVANVLGQLIEDPNPGRVEFELDGVRHSLEAIDSDDDLFYIVADRTSGRETYGLGRFLYSEWPDEQGRVVLDFNRLYNPPCAFSAFTTCPLPPEGNRLDAWVRAGELKYEGQAGRTEVDPAS